MASKGKVSFDFTANGAGVFRVTTALKKEMGELKSVAENALGGIKGAILGAVGIGTVTEMVTSAIEFGRELRKSSDELDVSIDRAAQLNEVMESVGKNSQDLVGSMGKVHKFMESADGDPNKMNLLKKFGIGQEDFKNFNFDTVLRKALTASQTMSPTESTIGLNKIFGKGMGADLLYRRNEILAKPDSLGLREEELRQLEGANAKFKSLQDAIKILILKAIFPLIGSIGNLNEIISGIANFPENYALQIIQDVLEQSLGKNLVTTILSNLMKAGFKVNQQEDLKKKYGLNYGEDDIKGKVSPLGSIGGNNQFLSIGGLIGTDVNYRVARLQEKAVEEQKKTNEYLSSIDNKLGTGITPPKEQPLPSYAGGNALPLRVPIM